MQAMSKLHVARIAATSLPVDGRFVLEGISEGGIRMLKWPGQEPGAGGHKCFRLGLRSYPYVDPDTHKFQYKKIGDEHNLLMFSRNDDTRTVLDTWIKALSGAPAWTPEELELFYGCMHRTWGDIAANIPPFVNV
jgi:hypothetical protein